MGVNVTKAGITKDLEVMKDSGIGGATTFNMPSGLTPFDSSIGNLPWPDITYRSPKWWEMVEFATAEAKRLGLELGMHNCVGYSATGGPWITPVLTLSGTARIQTAARRDGDIWIFFLSNADEIAREVKVSFKVQGKQPEIWNAEDGSHFPAALWSEVGGRTEVPLVLGARQSLFVVFRNPVQPGDHPVELTLEGGKNPAPAWALRGTGEGSASWVFSRSASGEVLFSSGRRRAVSVSVPAPLAVEGSWEVSFDPGMGAPEQTTFPSLLSWSENADPGIKYFSGTARYRKAIEIPSGFRDEGQGGELQDQLKGASRGQGSCEWDGEDRGNVGGRESGMNRKKVLGLTLLAAAIWSSSGYAGGEAGPLAIAARMAAVAPRFTAPTADEAYVMPVGSGDLSAMIRYERGWEIHLSKTDLFAYERNRYHKDQTIHSPGHVELSFGIPHEAITGFEQRLDYQRGSVVLEVSTVEGRVKAEAFGVMGSNILVVAVEDSRQPGGGQGLAALPVATFSNWRPGVGVTVDGNRVMAREVGVTLENGQAPSKAASVPPEDRMFNLGCGTAVAFVDGNGLMTATGKTGGQAPECTATLSPGHRTARYWLLIAVACTYDGKPDIVASNLLAVAIQADKASLLKAHLDWWSRFWQDSYLDLQGPGADTLLRLWYSGYYSYASVAGGATLPKFNGGPGLIHRDDRSWGWGYWWQNTRAQIWPLLAANRVNFARQALDYYDRTFMDWKAYTTRRGKVGLRMDEWLAPWKPGRLPPAKDVSRFDAAALERAIADRTMENVKSGYNARSLAQSTELTQLMFDYVAYTGDTGFLKETVAPWLKETTLFWLSYLRKGDDGLYHSMVTDAAEMWWKIKDSSIDLSAARFCFWHALNHGAEFGYEPEFIAAVRERADHLAPLPLGLWTRRNVKPEELPPGVPSNTTSIVVNDRTVNCYAPGDDLYDDRGSHNVENPELYLVYPFALVDANSSRAEVDRAVNTFRKRRAPNHAGWSQCPIQAARLRLDDAVEVIMDHARRHAKFPYGGWNSPACKLKGTVLDVNDTPYFDGMGVNLTAFQETLLQSHQLTTSAKTDLLGGGPLALVPAAHPEWSGEFKLLARGGFLVTATFKPGRRVTHAVIECRRGGALRLANPFGECRVSRVGHAAFSTKAPVIALDTRAGEVIELVW